MANKTLLQTRTDSPAVTPIDPDECLILDQQTDQPDGEQSTVATLSELIATGGRIVETDEAYETQYADSVVNVSAADIAITVGSVMRVGSRLLIRRTVAYDGNPVTITPPSGATFEGLASLSLYGQYSFVELERINSTLFAVKELKDEFYITFTPLFTGGSTWTLTGNVGTFSRKGNTCAISGRVNFSSLGDASGTFLGIQAPSSVPLSKNTQSCDFQVRSVASDIRPNSGYINASTRVFIPAELTTGGAVEQYNVSDLTNTSVFYFSTIYFT